MKLTLNKEMSFQWKHKLLKKDQCKKLQLCHASMKHICSSTDFCVIYLCPNFFITSELEEHAEHPTRSQCGFELSLSVNGSHLRPLWAQIHRAASAALSLSQLLPRLPVRIPPVAQSVKGNTLWDPIYGARNKMFLLKHEIELKVSDQVTVIRW